MTVPSYPVISLDRTILLPTPSPDATIELRWDPKSPGTDQDYSLDVTPWANDAGEVVTSFTAIVTTNGSSLVPLVANQIPLLDALPNVCSVELTGGASPTDCAVTFVINTPTRVLQLIVWISVLNLSPNLSRNRGVAVLGTSIDPGTAAALITLGNEIEAEVTRAEGVEGTLAGSLTALAAEVTAQEGATTSNTASLGVLTNELHNFEQSIDQGLFDEIARAEAAEAALQAQIDGLGQGSVTPQQLTAAVAQETLRAETEEEALAAAIAALGPAGVTTGQMNAAIAVETSRAEAAESSNHGSITAETTRAEAAEAALAASISGFATPAAIAAAVLVETNRAESAESSLQGSINMLSTGVTPAQLTAAVAVETTRAEAAESNLQGSINALSAGGVTPAQLSAAVLVETNRAEGAESSLQGSIGTERTRAEGAESALAASIAAIPGGKISEMVSGVTTLTNVGTLVIEGPATLTQGAAGSATLTIVGGGAGSLPDSAPLLSTNADGTATVTSVGAGLNLVGGVLSASDVMAPFNDFHPGTLAANQAIWIWLPGQPYVAGAGTPNWIISSGATATSATTLTLSQNGTLLTTGVVPAGGSLTALQVGAGFSANLGDVIVLRGPATPDASYADIATLLTFGVSLLPTTWNPFYKSSTISLDETDLIFTDNNPAFAWSTVRSTNARSAGTLYFEFKVSGAPGEDWVIGLCNNLTAIGDRGGDDTNSVTYNGGFGNFRFGGASISGPQGIGAIAVGDIFRVVVKLGTAPDLWMSRNLGPWNGDSAADPISGTNGLNSAPYFNGQLNTLLNGSVYVMAGAIDQNGIGTGNFGASPFAFTPPTNATAWG
jgi:hypothetical protein